MSESRVAFVRRHPTYHEVWKGYQGRYVRCECGDENRTHHEDPPPPGPPQPPRNPGWPKGYA